ncbi:4Fe-4S single cluster domain containing protein [uncultured Caudovirales phage]|uniref:4Fe-4S single cluster domain containing protein n=1 Tax=uncultured Caudovirales phage TaxID=2100421 RepID=A0A6J5TAD7_9CAUD|nr:4Fe-4S single cluster domain containing protein [uncultured Caudovirales phage]
MIELNHAEVSWSLNAYCKFQCAYCLPEFKSGELDKPIDQYLTIVEKLQRTRYQHHSKIYWEIGGGEPLHFPHLSTILKKIKEKPSIVRLDTSGDDTWFSLYGVINLIDIVKLTYHSWQNDDVFGFILEQCQEKNISVSVEVPLEPGRIFESREKVKYFKDLGYTCNEQILYDSSRQLHHKYSTVDVNRIFGRADDWEPEPVILDPNKPFPGYIDLSVVNNTDPIYTGLPCYAGVDWLHINPKGFVSYSQCSGRSEHFNAFDADWQPPSSHFPCSVKQCRNEHDRRKIRIIGS